MNVKHVNVTEVGPDTIRTNWSAFAIEVDTISDEATNKALEIRFIISPDFLS